jgi:hypothetical protein
LHRSCCTDLLERSNHDQRSTKTTTTTRAAAATKVINRRTCTFKSQLLIGHIAAELRVVLQTTTPLEQQQATAKWNQLMISQAQACEYSSWMMIPCCGNVPIKVDVQPCF